MNIKQYLAPWPLGRLWILSILLPCCALTACLEGDRSTAKSGESENGGKGYSINTANSKPWTYWWWMGSAVDKSNIDYNLKKYQEAGIGGVHIVPIYGVQGEEDRFIDYLSPEWVEMLAYTSEQCEILGLGLDMTLGTGWCFGGPDVDGNTGSMYGYFERLRIKGGMVQMDLQTKSRYDFNKVQSALAVYDDGTRIDLSDKIDANQFLDWKSSEDSLILYLLRMQGPVFEVKRPAPGGEGYMLDPFSKQAVDKYIKGFEEIFGDSLNQFVRAVYHDSYEYQADWTRQLFDDFEQRRGYDLRTYLPELVGEDSETSRRIVADYRQTMSELHEAYINRTAKWAKENGLLFRNQGHGSPANWLDIYAQADIPETETFGATAFKIPGLTREASFINNDRPNRFVLKFASSAANVMGKPLISSETNTWLREHFRVSLSHSKPELDQLFLSGINHIFYHGIAYSPKEAEWPGWQFYASTSFAPTNSIFYHFSAQNKYVERCQEALRTGKSDNDILLYYPIQDIWHSKVVVKKRKNKKDSNTSNFRSRLDILYKLTAHNYEDWLVPFPLYQTARELDNLGYTFDYISDKQILQTSVKADLLKTQGNEYRTLVVPPCDYIPIETFKAIRKLAQAGGKVVFLNDLPESVPGYFEWQARALELDKLKTEFQERSSGIEIVPLEKTELLETLLGEWHVKKEHFNEHGIPFIRRKTDDGYLYFISNIYGGKDVNTYIPLGVEALNVTFTDPLSGESSAARLVKNDGSTSVLLQLAQGQSLIIKTDKNEAKTLKGWPYVKSEHNPLEIAGVWKVDFIDGGPVLPASFTTDRLESWTALGDGEAQRFAGIARYTIDFNINQLTFDEYIIEFEKVRESARIMINGNTLPILFSHPFRTFIGSYLHEGKNTLQIEVANLAANRIRDLDIRGVHWKKFHNINFVNIDYKPFDASTWELVGSGLIGKVRIIPVELIK